MKLLVISGVGYIASVVRPTLVGHEITALDVSTGHRDVVRPMSRSLLSRASCGNGGAFSVSA